MIHDELFKSILENISDGVYFVDTDRVIEYWNKGAERITGYKASEATGRGCSENILVHVNEKGANLCKKMCPLAATIKDGNERSSQIFLQHKDGHRQPVYVSVSPIKDRSGKIVGGAECFYDNSQTLAALKEVDELKKESLICKVTGVGNRQYIEQFIEKKVEELNWKGGKMAVLGFEIDKYDQYKESFGQNVTDIIAKMVSRTLSNILQSYDLLSRISDREFVAVLPKVSLATYVDKAKLLCTLISRSSQTITDNKLYVTVSVGSYLVESTDTLQLILNRVTKLIQESKSSGGNRVTAL